MNSSGVVHADIAKNHEKKFLISNPDPDSDRVCFRTKPQSVPPCVKILLRSNVQFLRYVRGQIENKTDSIFDPPLWG